MRPLPALAKATFAGFLLALTAGLVAAFGARLGLWSTHFGLLTLFPWCVSLGIVTFIAGLIWILWAMIANDSTDARYGLLGLAGAVIVLSNPLYTLWNNAGMPIVTDVSTDTEHAPEFVSLLLQRDGAATPQHYEGNKPETFEGKLTTVALLQHKYYAELHSAAVLISPERLFKRAVSASYGMGWEVIAIVPDAGRIEASDTSTFFGFKDDIVIRVKPAGMGAKLDIRSKSRDTGDDYGRNAQRLRDFLKKLAKTNI